MNLKVKIAGRGGTITLTNKNYVAAGGQASIFRNGGMLFKVYHDPAKSIPTGKIQELNRIKNTHLILPKDIILDESTGLAIGYTTDFVDGAEPFIKLFTRTFKNQNNIDTSMIVDLVKQMQLITIDVHKANCLISDYNELNILFKVAHDIIIPSYIDVDSYVTPSYKATAIMDSVRDRRVSIYDKKGELHYNPDTMSDWFSWGILAFWSYVNIHPFRGGHPKYKGDRQKMMDDGISVFHKNVSVPPTVEDFRIIPKRHLAWFIDTFKDNHRSIPPFPDSSIPLPVPTQIVIIKGSKTIEVFERESYPEEISSFYHFMGVSHAIGKTKIYRGTKVLMEHKSKKVVLCMAPNGSVIAGLLSGNTIEFFELITNKKIGSISGDNMFSRNNCIYTTAAGKLIENSFVNYGANPIHKTKEIENISQFSAKMYEGCIIQDLLGKKYVTIPYSVGSCLSKHVPELSGYRIIEAKSDKWVTVIVAEKGGKYYRFIIVFNQDYSQFQVREIADVNYDTINMCVIEQNKLCLLLASPTELELFKDHNHVQVMDNPPFDSNMKLVATPEGIFFINNNSIHQIRKK